MHIIFLLSSLCAVLPLDALRIIKAHDPLPPRELKTDTATQTAPFGVENSIFVLKHRIVKFAKQAGHSGLVDFNIAPPVLFTHLLKAGGSHIFELLEQIFKNGIPSGPGYQRQTGGFTKGESDDQPTEQEILDDLAERVDGIDSKSTKYFRIGSIRNPCDYLVSLWAFQSDTGHGQWPRECLERSYGSGAKELYAEDDKNPNNTNDIERFRKWVRATAGNFTKMHYMSYRSYLALHSKAVPKVQAWDDGQYFACISDLSPKEEEPIVNELMAADFSKRYDCLIHTETLVTDLYTCMMQYSTHIKQDSIRENFLQNLKDSDLSPDRPPPPPSNEGSHAPCQAYFDDATTKFVWAREGPFAKKMGYQSCCKGT